MADERDELLWRRAKQAQAKLTKLPIVDNMQFTVVRRALQGICCPKLLNFVFFA